MAKCKSNLPLSNLDTIVDLFRKAYDEVPVWQSLRYDAYSGLATALGVRFIYAGNFDDYIEFIAILQSQMSNIEHHRDERTNVRHVLLW